MSVAEQQFTDTVSKLQTEFPEMEFNTTWNSEKKFGKLVVKNSGGYKVKVNVLYEYVAPDKPKLMFYEVETAMRIKSIKTYIKNMLM